MNTNAPQAEVCSSDRLGIDPEREAFEAWVESTFGPLTRDAKLDYLYTDVRAAWRAWQQRAKAQADCSWNGGNEPCPICPRRIAALHLCKLLQDSAA